MVQRGPVRWRAGCALRAASQVRQHRRPSAADTRERYDAAARAVRDILSDRWVRTDQTYERENPKRVYYVSIQFLIGRSLSNNIMNLICALCRGVSRKSWSQHRINIQENNARLLRELQGVGSERRKARFVCVLAAARDGATLQMFRGVAEGIILDRPAGSNGFGYDPLFFFPHIGKTFAQLTAEEKARYSHRGAAFRQFLHWFVQQTRAQ